MDDSRLNDIEFEIRKASVDYDYNTTEYSIGAIVNKYKIEKIFGPYHHQNVVWNDESKSKYIESILLEMPIMPFVAYLSKEDTKIEIIDGSNRIEALVDYCFDNLQLCSLEILTSLNETKFSDLPTWIKGKLLGKWIKFYLMASEQHDIHIDIYYRYNTIQD